MKAQAPRVKKILPAAAARRPARRASRPSALARVASIPIDANRTLLNRYRFVEHESLLMLAGWLPRAATFELKCEMGRALWENAQHVNALYLRLREVQSPASRSPPTAPWST